MHLIDRVWGWLTLITSQTALCSAMKSDWRLETPNHRFRMSPAMGSSFWLSTASQPFAPILSFPSFFDLTWSFASAVLPYITLASLSTPLQMLVDHLIGYFKLLICHTFEVHNQNTLQKCHSKLHNITLGVTKSACDIQEFCSVDIGCIIKRELM